MTKLQRVSTLSLFVLALLAAGCSTTPVNLSYAPTGSPQAAFKEIPASVTVGEFSDDRGEPSHWIGAIRGGFGNPIKTLETTDPVSKMVEEVVKQALQTYGFYASDGLYLVKGSIQQLEGGQYARKEANVKIEMALIDRDTRNEIFQRTVAVSDVTGSVFTLKTGVFGSVEELRALIERVLSEAVDEFIGSPSFGNAIKRARAAGK